MAPAPQTTGYRQATTVWMTTGPPTRTSGRSAGSRESTCELELTDGVNVLGMETVGQLRANATPVDGTIGD